MTENEHLPYKAVNVFIDREYLELVISTILNDIQELPKEDQIDFSKFFKQYVKVLGFRNPTRAPKPLQVNAYASAFEEKDEVVVYTLSTWTKIKPELAKAVNTWLESEGWENLALVRDYSETDGFRAVWPEKLSFDKLVNDFKKANPEVEFSDNDLILMVLWVSGQLPPEQSDL